MDRFPTSRQLETSMLANLEGLLLPGTKKVPKIYKMACHPLQPHLVAVGANAGPLLHRFLTFIRPAAAHSTV